MPSRGGKSSKRKKNGQGVAARQRELLLKEDEQEYGQIKKNMGATMQVLCFDGKDRICKIRGKLKNRIFMNEGDVVLIGLRDFQESKADIIHLYTADEARKLKTMGELPSNFEFTNSSQAVHLEGKAQDLDAFDFSAI